MTRRGTETAVLLPIEDWRRLQTAARQSLKQLLMVDFARTDALVPERREAMTLVRGLTVVTRNVADFEAFHVDILNPFEYRASG